MIFETSRYTNLQFKIIRKKLTDMDGSPLAVQHKWSKGTSYGLEVSFQGDWLFFCNSDIWQSWHSLSANLLSNAMFATISIEGGSVDKIFINIFGNNTSHSLPLALMEASAESNLPYAQLSFAWQSTLLFNVHRSGGLTHSSSTEETPICTRSDIPFSWSLPFITLQLFHEHHTSNWFLQSGKPTKNLQTKVEICPNRTWVQ